MISDIDILSILQDRQSCEDYYSHVEGSFLSREGESIGRAIHAFFEQDISKSILSVEWDKFGIYYFLKNPMLGATQKDIYKEIFKSLNTRTPDEAFKKTILEVLAVKTCASKISGIALDIADGSKEETELNTIRDLLDKHQSTIIAMSPNDPTLVTTDVEELFKDDPTRPKLEFSLDGLKAACGGIGIGDFVVVGACADSGKSTFLMDEATNMFKQIPKDRYVMYFNNEQSGAAMQKRIVSSMLSMGERDILVDPSKANALYRDATEDRLLLWDATHMTFDYVEQRLKKYKDKIGLILIDQLWKIKGLNNKNSSDYMALAKQFAWARDLAKEYAPVIAVHQADGSSYGVKYIGMGGMFGSRVAVQGEADAIITIGRVTDGSMPENIRHFHVPKNKLAGADPTARNIKFDAKINHNLVRFENTKGL